MVIQIARSEEEALSACRLTLQENKTPSWGCWLDLGPSLPAAEEHSIQERTEAWSLADLGPGRPGVGNRCSEGTRCCVTGVAGGQKAAQHWESAQGGPGPLASHRSAESCFREWQALLFIPGTLVCPLESPHTQQKAPETSCPTWSAHEGSWTVGWPSLVGETSWSKAGCRRRGPHRPRKTATSQRPVLPAHPSTRYKPELPGRLWPPPFSLCSRRQARPTWTSTRQHVSSAFLSAENPGSGQDCPERSCPHAPTVTRAPAGGAAAAPGGAARLCPAPTHSAPSHQVLSRLRNSLLKARLSRACFCFQFLGTDFLKFPYSYISYL